MKNKTTVDSQNPHPLAAPSRRHNAQSAAQEAHHLPGKPKGENGRSRHKKHSKEAGTATTASTHAPTHGHGNKAGHHEETL